jgi:hypothetical protein
MSLIQLEFLTSSENIIQICTLYWEHDEQGSFIYKLTDLAKMQNLSSKELSKFVGQHCRALATNDVCSGCGVFYVYKNRSDFQQRIRYRYDNWLCAACIEQERARQKALQIAEEERQCALIDITFSSVEKPPIDLNQLTFEHAVYLLSLVRLAASEDFSYIMPLRLTTEPLAPTENFTYEVIRQLFQHKLIYISPKSSIDAFVFQNEGIERFYLDRVSWDLPISSGSKNSQGLIEELEAIFRNGNWPESWRNEWRALWKKIALQECLQYLEVGLNEHGLSLNPGEKTYLVLNGALEQYSVAQIYNMIWRAVRDAAAFYVRERVPKQHAANTVIGSIQRQADRAKAEGWDLKPYRRDFRCPQSMISQVLFDTALQIGEKGFNSPPGALSEDAA